MLIHGLHFNNIKGDIFGGVVAAVIAIPLALAFGVASGAGAEAGLYGAIFVGFFAAIFGGTPAQASGPTGPDDGGLCRSSSGNGQPIQNWSLRRSF